MKVFAAILLIAAAAIGCVAAADSMVGSSYGGGGASIPAPPCPKNYLFSCQPSLQPAPCAQPPPSYGGAGAYSENYQTYVLPSVPQFQGY